MFTLWFMGRPASGKSTLAAQVEQRLVERGHPFENLDGDEVRKNLHPELGFTREDRAINNRRTAFIAKLLNRNAINAIVAMITPFRDAQRRAREVIEKEGEFVLIYVKTPLAVCEERDPKGMYEQAREEKIENFTGINHPFQEPQNPDIVVDTEIMDIEDSVRNILDRLQQLDIFDRTAAGDYGYDMSKDEEQRAEQRLRELGYLDEG